MSMRLLNDLDLVLRLSQKSIRLDQGISFCFGNKFSARERREGRQSTRSSYFRHISAVHQLQCLREEFDFADAAVTEFEVALLFAGAPQFVFAASFHMTELVYRCVIEVAPLDKRLELLQEFCSELNRASNRPGFDQRGALPTLSPRFVVKQRRVYGLDERAAVSHRT